MAKDSFFIGGMKKKRKPSKAESQSEDENVDDMNLEHERVESEEEIQETPAQKRLRLAKSYLAKIQQDIDDDIIEGEIDAKEIDKDLIAERLAKENDESMGRIYHQIASGYEQIDMRNAREFASKKNGHHLSPTALAFANLGMSKDAERPELYIYSGSKDSVLVKWDFWTGKKMHVFAGNRKQIKSSANKNKENDKVEPIGHNLEILCMDASSDGKYVVSLNMILALDRVNTLKSTEFGENVTGGADKTIYVWSVKDDTLLGKLHQHRDSVSCLKFRTGHHDLYSCSYDRTVKVWNVETLSYVETLFGHQDKITSIDSLSKERCVTTGSRDRTCRLWKILEESQLVFRGGGGLKASEDLVVMEGLAGTGKKREKDSGLSGGSIDVVAMIDEDHFVSGSDSGAISLWSTSKKKPIFTKLKCHGLGTAVKVNGEESKVQAHSATTPFDDTTCSWITSLATVRYSDMFASGSGDGYIRLWKLSDTKKSFGLLNCIPCDGFVNDLIFFQAPPLSFTNKVRTQTVEGSAVVRKIAESANEERRTKSIPSELYIAAAVGQEYRLGRWWRRKDIKNRIIVLGLSKGTSQVQI